ncbi:carbohydrate ABC transporter permease [Paractinoplanes rishiriensis]|uniref:Glycerol-3-phosphate ABC transporter permease n=1 Tax=Paractinoplanes rishiriensis TaxID=1050105 RepID=A0A919MYZ2_9ACTN|nr:sugar ABC transporter permease [Actinoplanes rishiriensis]GIF00555.1 glycerol-3-phosphate ABC transporter permease [Actinoplanes rishiriensis]
MSLATKPAQGVPRFDPARPASQWATLRRRLLHRQSVTALGFLSPALAVLAFFVMWPMAHSLAISFTDAGLIQDGEWVGLDNYMSLASDERFRNALGNTALYALVTTPVSTVLALALAVALNRRLPARGLFRTALFLPFVASLSIAAIAWAFLMDPQIGLVTGWLEGVGIPTGNGIDDPALALPAVVLVGVWRNVGFFMVMFLAGLQSIPRELTEAAMIDGAGPWARFRRVTLPLLANTTMFVTIIGTIFSLQVFDQIYVMTAGGPYFRTESIVMLTYDRAFESLDMGSATAISWVLVLIVLAVSVLQLTFFNRRAVRY